MFTCPLCRTEWVITAKMCEQCERVRHLMSIYGRDQIVSVLDKCLVKDVEKALEKAKKEKEAEKQ